MKIYAVFSSNAAMTLLHSLHLEEEEAKKAKARAEYGGKKGRISSWEVEDPFSYLARKALLNNMARLEESDFVVDRLLLMIAEMLRAYNKSDFDKSSRIRKELLIELICFESGAPNPFDELEEFINTYKKED